MTGLDSTDDEPVTQWATRVTYPPGSAVAVPGPLLIPAENSGVAEIRAGWHRNNGAEAVVLRRQWTPTPWITFTDNPTRKDRT